MTHHMPLKIPEVVKNEIILSLFSGSFRKEIATKHHVSEGLVSNIMAEWKSKYGSEQLDTLRTLSIAMRRSGLSVQQCADGHRVAMLMRRLGVDEERFEDFVLKTWKLYVRTGLNPETLEKQVNELYYFLSQNNGLGAGVSIFRIGENINTLRSEEAALNNKVASLKSKNNELENGNSELQSIYESVNVELGANVEFRNRLKANGFQNAEILDSLDLLLLVKKSGYTIGDAIKRFSNFCRLDKENATLHQNILHQESRQNLLVKQNYDLEELCSKNSQTIRELEYVKGLGFGLSELKKLRHKLDEVDEQAGKPSGSRASIEKFFEIFDDHYFDSYNLTNKLKELRSEMVELHKNRDRLLSAIGLTPDLVIMIHSLVSKGISREDIPDLVNKIVEKYQTTHSISWKIETNSHIDSHNPKQNWKIESPHGFVSGDSGENREELRARVMATPVFDLSVKEITECPPCGVGQIIPIDEDEIPSLDCGSNKIPAIERKTGETIDKSKLNVRPDAHVTDMQQPSSKKIYNTKDRCDDGVCFHPQLIPSPGNNVGNLRMVRRSPMPIGMRWKNLQSRFRKDMQTVEKVSKESSHNYKSIEHKVDETNRSPAVTHPPMTYQDVKMNGRDQEKEIIKGNFTQVVCKTFDGIEKGPSMITVSSLTSHSGVTIPELNRLSPQYDNHTPEKARKKPLFPRPLPKPKSLQAPSVSAQEKINELAYSDQGFATYERYDASSLTDNNTVDDIAVISLNQEPVPDINHDQLEYSDESEPVRISVSSEETSVGNNLQTAQAKKNSWDFSLASLIDESTIRPIMKQLGLSTDSTV